MRGGRSENIWCESRKNEESRQEGLSKDRVENTGHKQQEGDSKN